MHKVKTTNFLIKCSTCKCTVISHSLSINYNVLLWFDPILGLKPWRIVSGQHIGAAHHYKLAQWFLSLPFTSIDLGSNPSVSDQILAFGCSVLTWLQGLSTFSSVQNCPPTSKTDISSIFIYHFFSSNALCYWLLGGALNSIGVGSVIFAVSSIWFKGRYM